jgi:hypothetical protein
MRTWLCVASILALSLAGCESEGGTGGAPLQDQGSAADTAGGGQVADPGAPSAKDEGAAPADLPPANSQDIAAGEDTGAPRCLGEGESRPVVPNAPDCCAGLAPIGCEAPTENGVCLGEPCVGAAICASCGNGTCGPGENLCNCPHDCPGGAKCVAEGESRPVVPDAPECCAGLAPIPCGGPGEDGTCPAEPCVGAAICASCGNGTCGPGENICNCPDDCDAGAQCTAEGESRPAVPNALECCAGLEPIGCDGPVEDGDCPDTPCLGVSICANCGDGECGPGENHCNCEDDCQGPVACVTEGGSTPVVPDAPKCCEGLEPISCHVPGEDDSCETPCMGVSICAKCGNGTCGPGENLCNCPLDCEAGAQCIEEGGSRPVVPNAPECCAGLAPIPCGGPGEDGACPADPCVGAAICASCGNGTCGPGENICNCPADCSG